MYSGFRVWSLSINRNRLLFMQAKKSDQCLWGISLTGHQYLMHLFKDLGAHCIALTDAEPQMPDADVPWLARTWGLESP